MTKSIPLILAAVSLFSSAASMATPRDGSIIGPDGVAMSAPAPAVPSTVTRAEVARQSPSAVRAQIADAVQAGGEGGGPVAQPRAVSTVTRAQLRTEAVAAVQRNVANPLLAAGHGS